jgi:hypothetical protein
LDHRALDHMDHYTAVAADEFVQFRALLRFAYTDVDMEEEEDGDIESEAVPRGRQLRLGEAQAILRDSASRPCHLIDAGTMKTILAIAVRHRLCCDALRERVAWICCGSQGSHWQQGSVTGFEDKLTVVHV